MGSGGLRREGLADDVVWYAALTSFAIMCGLFRRAETRASTPSGRFNDSNAIRVTWTFESCSRQSVMGNDHPIHAPVCLFANLRTSNILPNQRSSRLLQRIQEQSKRRRSVPQTQELRNEQQIVRLSMGKICRSHDS